MMMLVVEIVSNVNLLIVWIVFKECFLSISSSVQSLEWKRFTFETPIPGGDYSNYFFIEPQLTPICFRIRLFHCIFKDFRSSNPGGSFLALDTTVVAESTIWSSIV
jgi:hypothetical protein